MGVQGLLISARFLVTIGHLTSMFLLFSTIENNIQVSLGDGATATEYSLAYQSSITALIFGVLCVMIDFSGILRGTSLFNHTVIHSLAVATQECSSLLLQQFTNESLCDYFHHCEKPNFKHYHHTLGKSDTNPFPFCRRRVSLFVDHSKFWIPSVVANYNRNEFSSSNCRAVHANKNPHPEVNPLLTHEMI